MDEWRSWKTVKNGSAQKLCNIFAWPKVYGCFLKIFNDCQQKHIDLLYNQDEGGHVDLITRMKGLFRARFYCYAWHKTYSTSKNICPTSSCVLCRQAECKNRCGRLNSYQVGERAPCTTCGMKLKFQLWKDCHTSLCASFRQCPTCSACVAKQLISSHKCSKTRCIICSQNFDTEKMICTSASINHR